MPDWRLVETDIRHPAPFHRLEDLLRYSGLRHLQKTEEIGEQRIAFPKVAVALLAFEDLCSIVWTTSRKNVPNRCGVRVILCLDTHGGFADRADGPLSSGGNEAIIREV